MSLSDAERRLRRALTGEVLRSEPMARHTTYRIGGPADLFIVCDTIADLAEALRVCDEEGIERTVIGKGSNLLVADAGYRGAIIVLGREFRTRRVQGTDIEAGAGCILAYVVQDAYSRGLAGMEFGVGIPGTLGGAITMNAGTADAWMQSVTRSVTVYIPGSGLERLSGHDIEWGYRHAGLPEGAVIAEAALSLSEGDKEAIRRLMERRLEHRKRTQPVGMKSAGSVFRNPPGESAGRLIESAGLKGTRLGGAKVSQVHANFIVNEGGACAADVLGLIRKVQMTVRDVHGIELTPEIRFIGSFEGP